MVSLQPLSATQLRYCWHPGVDLPVIGQALWERKAEGNICVQTVYWKCPLDQHLWRRAGSMTGQRKNLKSNTVITKDFVDPNGELWSWNGPCDLPHIEARGQAFVPPHQPITRYGFLSSTRGNSRRGTGLTAVNHNPLPHSFPPPPYSHSTSHPQQRKEWLIESSRAEGIWKCNSGMSRMPLASLSHSHSSISKIKNSPRPEDRLVTKW